MIWKRFLAFLIDYFILVIYGTLLFGLSTFLLESDLHFGPLKGQLIGLITMTIPVFLYFYLLESGKSHATVGKRLLKLRVVGENANYFKRNLLKFIPWEIAHTGVHWVVYYSDNSMNVPAWNWIFLVLPQIIVFGYMISILAFKGKSSIYDKMAKTSVQNS